MEESKQSKLLDYAQMLWDSQATKEEVKAAMLRVGANEEDAESIVEQVFKGKKPFVELFSFRGRIRRREYWSLNFLLSGIWFPFEVIEEPPMAMVLVYLALIVPTYWIGFATAAKRCHDRGNSGWWQLIPFYNLWLAFGDSEKGDNEYGPSPKQYEE